MSNRVLILSIIILFCGITLVSGTSHPISEPAPANVTAPVAENTSHNVEAAAPSHYADNAPAKKTPDFPAYSSLVALVSISVYIHYSKYQKRK